MVAAVEQEEQPGQGSSGVRQLPLTVLGQGEGQGVGQGEQDRQGGQGVHPHPPPEGAPEPRPEHIQGEEGPQTQQSGGDPDLELIPVQRGQPIEAGGGDSQLEQSGGGQQKDQDSPQAHLLQTFAVGTGQLLGRKVGGRRFRLPGHADPAGGLRGLLLVGARDQFLQAADLLRVHALRLLEHLVGIAVRLLGDIFEKGGQYALHPAGLLVVLPVFRGGGILPIGLVCLKGGLFQLLRRGREGAAWKGDNLAGVLGGWGGGRDGNSGALGAPPGPILRQNVLQGEGTGLRIPAQRLTFRQLIVVQLFGFLVTVVHIGSSVSCFWVRRSRLNRIFYLKNTKRNAGSAAGALADGLIEEDSGGGGGIQ